MGLAARTYRFGRFELDAHSGALSRDGVTQQLHDQPLRALLLLIERSGDVVTRDELRRHLWRDETFVDFEHGLNSIVKRLREALGDTADRPLFIQTLPRRGYRFLVAVEALPELAPAPAASSGGTPPVEERSWRRSSTWILAVGLVISLAGGGFAILRWSDRRDRPITHPASRPMRLAVLPFENLTGIQDQQFFADGLHEEMIFRLGRLQPRQLMVIARTSVVRYRDEAKGIATIGRELGVDFVLEGSVRQAGDRVRVSAQLIRAADQSQLWTESYDRSWDDVLAIQSDVSARIADSLAVELLPASEADGRDARVRRKAYEHYLKGRYYWNQRTRDPSAQLSRAIEQFRLAIAEQPDYALAYGGLADAYNSIFFANPAVGDTPYANAHQALERALELDPRLASAYSTLAWMTLHFDRNLPDAERAFARALELDPTDSLTRFRHAHLLAIQDRVREAEVEAEAARQSDPLSAPIADIQGWLAYYRGDNATAMQRMKEASELEGDSARVGAFAAYVDAGRGDCVRVASQLEPWVLDVSTLRRGEAVFARTRCSAQGSVEALHQALLTKRLTYSIAMFHLAKGEREAFYEWLNRAIDERFPEPLYLAVDPIFSSERADPRFRAALRRIGVSEDR